MTPWETCPNCGDLRQLNQRYSPPICEMCRAIDRNEAKQGTCEMCKQPRMVRRAFGGLLCQDCTEQWKVDTSISFHVPQYLCTDFAVSMRTYAAQWVAEHARVKV